MFAQHLKLNKKELLFLQEKPCSLQVLSTTVSSSQWAKNLGVTMDNTLSFSANLKAVICSCRFMLYNRKRLRS
jgi:hypothetical protein